MLPISALCKLGSLMQVNCLHAVSKQLTYSKWHTVCIIDREKKPSLKNNFLWVVLQQSCLQQSCKTCKNDLRIGSEGVKFNQHTIYLEKSEADMQCSALKFNTSCTVVGYTVYGTYITFVTISLYWKWDGLSWTQFSGCTSASEINYSNVSLKRHCCIQMEGIHWNTLEFPCFVLLTRMSKDTRILILHINLFVCLFIHLLVCLFLLN